MPLRIRDPFEEMERWMAPFGSPLHGAVMPMDAYEQDGTYTLRFDLPGVDPERVDVTVERNVLTVTADRPEEEPENATWLLRERPTGTHRREVRLGERFETSKVNASYDNGVLTVTIPVHEESLPRRVSVARTSSKAIEAEATEEA
jgi:HSP20 family protein